MDILIVGIVISIVTVLVIKLLPNLRRYFRGAQFDEDVCAKNKIAIVTGGSGGIGSRIALGLNKRGAKVYLFCRNMEKAKTTIQKLVKENDAVSNRLIPILCNFASFASVRRAVLEFQQRENQLDILVNNAGVFSHPVFELTEDNHEILWQSNYLGHFLLTQLLLSRLQIAEAGRIINVSSIVNTMADNVKHETMNNPDAPWSYFRTYARCKLAQIMYSVALTSRLRENEATSRITVNSCHPGCVETDLVRNMSFTSKFPDFLRPLRLFVLKTENDGAQIALFLALSKHVNNVSGKYFIEMKEANANPLTLDKSACDILFSESLTDVKLC